MLRKSTLLIGTKEELLGWFRAEGKKDISSTLTIEGQLDLLPLIDAPSTQAPAALIFYMEELPEQIVDGVPTVEMRLTSVFVQVYSKEEAARWEKLRAQHHMG